MKGIALLLAALAGGAKVAPGGRVLLELRDMSGWQAHASEQVDAALHRDADGSVCLEYDFHSVSGYAVLRHVLPVQWPAAFALQLRMKGRGAVNDLQVKLVDASGDNVWWVNRPSFPLPRSPTDVSFRSDHFRFAWGPIANRTLVRTEALELVIAAGRQGGGKGALCVSRLRLQERDADPAVWPEPLARWRAGILDLDYRRTREIHGLTLQWPGKARPMRYDVLGSEDSRSWKLLRRVQRSSGGFEALFSSRDRGPLPEGPPAGGERRPTSSCGTARMARPQCRPLRACPARAARTRAARIPGRAELLGTGGRGWGWRALGAAERGRGARARRGGFSVEPAVLTEGGELATWADVQIEHSLRESYLPMPEVRWQHGAFSLLVAAAAEGPAGAPQLLVRYALTNTGRAARAFTLLLAVRPWQVNPPQQFLNTPGGARRIDCLQWRAPRLSVNGAAGPCFAEVPSRVTALPGAGGIDLNALRDAAALRDLSDAEGQASALLQWDLRLSPGETRVVTFTAPLGAAHGASSARAVEERLDRVAAGWRVRLNRMELTLPASSQQVADTLRTALARS